MSINNRYEFMFFIECINGNPNGDPDMGNCPRIDPEDMHGYITDVAIKRRIRNYVQMAYGDEDGMDIIIQDSTNTNRFIAEVKEKNAGIKPDDKSKEGVKKGREAACKRFFDVRTFGGVLSTGPNAGQVRGPVQLTFGKSIDIICIQDISITRMGKAQELKDKKLEKTVENYKKLENETDDDKQQTIGRKQFISYGLYEVRGFISANLAHYETNSKNENGTGFDERDLKILFESILNMYEHDRSASKGQMSVISPLIIFQHVGTDTNEQQRQKQAVIGCAPAHKLFDLVEIKRKSDIKLARNYKDYDISINVNEIPNGIKVGLKEDAFGEINWVDKDKENCGISQNSWIKIRE